MKQLIVNADDFGLSQSVNRGIIFGHQHGIVTSTTLMANLPGFEDAVALAKSNPALGIGVHLNLCRGKALRSPARVRSLTDSEGNLLPTREIFKRVYRKKISISEVESEWKAQIACVKEAGIEITHLDSEKHLHVLPILSKALVDIAKYFGILRVRLPQENISRCGIGRFLNPQYYKLLYLNRRASVLRPLFSKNYLYFTDYFLGVMLSKNFTEGKLARALGRLHPGVSELMVHPGYVDQELIQISQRYHYSLLKSREDELKALTSMRIKEILNRQKIQLIHYGLLGG